MAVIAEALAHGIDRMLGHKSHPNGLTVIQHEPMLASPLQARYDSWRESWVSLLSSREIVSSMNTYINAREDLHYYCARRPQRGRSAQRVACMRSRLARAEELLEQQKESWVAEDRERVLFYTLERPHRKVDVFIRYAARCNGNGAEAIQGLLHEQEAIIQTGSLEKFGMYGKKR